MLKPTGQLPVFRLLISAHCCRLHRPTGRFMCLGQMLIYKGSARTPAICGADVFVVCGQVETSPAL